MGYQLKRTFRFWLHVCLTLEQWSESLIGFFNFSHSDQRFCTADLSIILHCLKYRNLVQFPGVKILWKRTVQCQNSGGKILNKH